MAFSVEQRFGSNRNVSLNPGVFIAAFGVNSNSVGGVARDWDLTVSNKDKTHGDDWK